MHLPGTVDSNSHIPLIPCHPLTSLGVKKTFPQDMDGVLDHCLREVWNQKKIGMVFLRQLLLCEVVHVLICAEMRGSS